MGYNRPQPKGFFFHLVLFFVVEHDLKSDMYDLDYCFFLCPSGNFIYIGIHNELSFFILMEIVNRVGISWYLLICVFIVFSLPDSPRWRALGSFYL